MMFSSLTEVDDIFPYYLAGLVRDEVQRSLIQFLYLIYFKNQINKIY
jgi:hypothetical protein